MSYLYMTEESDDPKGPNNLVLHKLPWRSDSKCRFNIQSNIDSI